jgi:hypothetical protein
MEEKTLQGYKVFNLIEPHHRVVEALEKNHPGLMRILEPLGQKVEAFFKNRLRVDTERLEQFVHPQEDYVLISEWYPIFAVADGVTLELNADGTYPVPSGAADVARIFCEAFVKAAEQRFKDMSEAALGETFGAANAAVGVYNESKERREDTINYWDYDLFAATAAFAVIKDDCVFWGSLCDSFVARIDTKGNLVFKSPECWPLERQQKYLPADWQSHPEGERKKEIRRVYRNGVNEKGELIGYGVVTGEHAAERYVNYGSFTLEPGECIMFYTDGFEQYFNVPEFRALFAQWPGDLDARVIEMTRAKAKEDPKNFGHERSLIAVARRAGNG